MVDSASDRIETAAGTDAIPQPARRRTAPRRWLMAGLVCCLAAALLAAGLVAATWIYFHPRCDWQRGIVYGERRGEPLMIDILTPAAPNGLGIAFMVSGGWKSSPTSFRPWLMAPLLRHGFTVFAVFHVPQPRVTVDEIVADISRGVRYVRAHAAEFRVDPDRIGVTGGSSGGHLALMLATRGGPGETGSADPLAAVSSEVQAAAVFCPVTDLTDLTGSTEDPGDGGPPPSFRKAFDQEPVDMARWHDIARDLSPLFHVTADLPPILIHHGDRDTLVPLDQSIRFCDRAKTLGRDVTLAVVNGAGHGWLTMPWHILRCAAWFDSRLGKH
jgi:acetyl esterase/lipase